MATDDADRRAKEVVDAELWLYRDYITDADGEERSFEAVSRDELARQIAAAIRAAVAAQREKDAQVADRIAEEYSGGPDAVAAAREVAAAIREGKV